MAEQGTTGRTAAQRLAEWRALLALALTRALALLSLPAVIWVGWDALRLGAPQVALIVAVYQLSCLTCALVTVDARTRGWWTIANLTGVLWLVTPFTGVQGGQGAVILLIAVVGVLVLGARDGALALGTSVAGLMLWFTLVALGIAERPPALLADSGPPSTALRALVVSGTFGAIALLAMSYQIRELLRTLSESEARVAAQHVEMAAREEEARRRQKAEAGLLRAQKLETIGRLAGSVAHDVNNNLTVILSAAEQLEQQATLPRAQQRLAEQIREACESASLLTRQLLSLGRRELSSPEPVALATLLPRLERLLRTLLGTRIRVALTLPDELPRVHVDPRQLEQVILNLAINARDAMPDGGSIVISAELCDSLPSYQLVTSEQVPSRAVCVHVSDDGVGIDAAHLPQLGEPFFTTKGDEGTGLGLAAARAFVEASGGRLGVRTERGLGSTFTLELPPMESIAPRPSVLPTSSVRVLVVDDDARVRASIASVLSAAGYEVQVAADGVEALARAAEQPIDLLCTDVIMPRLGGLEFLERFGVAHPDTRVLICSAYVGELHLRELVRKGHYVALPKPFVAAELRDAALRAMLDSSAAPSRADDTHLSA